MSICSKILGLTIGMILLLNLSIYAQKGLGETEGISRTNIHPKIVSLSGIIDQIKNGPCEYATGHAMTGTHLFIYTEESDDPINIHAGAAYAVVFS